MGKMSEIASCISSLRSAAKFITTAADGLESLFSETEGEPKSSAQDLSPQQEPKPITLETVRAVLAEKSRDGHTEAIRNLLESHGASKLSEIDPTKYGELLADAEVLGNG